MVPSPGRRGKDEACLPPVAPGQGRRGREHACSPVAPDPILNRSGATGPPPHAARSHMGDGMPAQGLTPRGHSGPGSVAPRRPRPRPARLWVRLLAAVLAMGSVACDDSFSPIPSSAQRLSVWGYLEVTRDTQWIRIGALRPTVFTSGDSLPLVATLEDLTRGEIIHLRQTTVRWDIVAPTDSNGTTVHNFWTTAPIRPGSAFRFRAGGGIANPVDAMIRVPPDYRMEVLLGQSWNPSRRDSLDLIGLQHVAFVRATSVTVDSCGAASVDDEFPPVSDTLHDSHATPLIRPVPARRPGCGPRFVVGRTLSVVGSGSAWLQGSGGWGMGDIGPGNIANGVGFVGGTLSKTIPYENCDYVSSSGSNRHCRLHYDAATVTLTGGVWDPVCALPVPRALVTLQELDPPAPEVAKIRSIYTDKDGRFWISALEPGMRYALTVHRNERPAMWGGGPFQEFEDYHATLAFSPGQQATHDLELLGHAFLLCPLR